MVLETSRKCKAEQHDYSSKDRPEQFLCFPPFNDVHVVSVSRHLKLVPRSISATCSLTLLLKALTKCTVTLPFVHVLEVTLRFVFAGKAVVAAVLASNNRTIIFCSVGAMFGRVVTDNVAPFDEVSVAVFLEACIFASFEEMGFLMASTKYRSVSCPKTVNQSFPPIMVHDPIAAWKTVVGKASSIHVLPIKVLSHPNGQTGRTKASDSTLSGDTAPSDQQLKKKAYAASAP